MKFNLTFLLLNALSISAFVPSKPVTNNLHAVKSDIALASSNEAPVKVPVGEENRKLRRDVFGHDDWIKYRRSDRFLYNLSTIASSGIWRQVAAEVASITTIATLVVLWNDLMSVGYTDFSGLQHSPLTNLPPLTLPTIPFTLASPSLGLLLVFRTNASYGRWAEGRQQWGVMGTECRNVMRMAASWSSPMREPDKQKRVAAIQSVGTACYTFMRSLLRHVSGPPDEEDFQKDLRAALPEKEAEAIIAAGHRPFRALFLLSRRIEALPLSERQRIEVDKSCVIIGDTCGGTERVYGTPIPLSYTRHTSRFLTVWLMGLPLALYDGFANTWNHIGMIPAASLIAVFLYGIEELSVYLEEPFSILALPGMVQAMKNFSEQLPEWHAMYTEGEFSDQVYGGEEFWDPDVRGSKNLDKAKKTVSPTKEKFSKIPYKSSYY